MHDEANIVSESDAKKYFYATEKMDNRGFHYVIARFCGAVEGGYLFYGLNIS